MQKHAAFTFRFLWKSLLNGRTKQTAKKKNIIKSFVSTLGQQLVIIETNFFRPFPHNLIN